MDLHDLENTPPPIKTIILKSIVLILVVIIVLYLQYFAPRTPLPRATEPFLLRTQVLGLIDTIPPPSSPLDRLKLSLSSKLDTTRVQLNDKLQNSKEYVIKTTKDKIASTQAHLEGNLVEFYISRISQSLDKLLPNEKEKVLQNISDLLTPIPTNSPVATPIESLEELFSHPSSTNQ